MWFLQVLALGWRSQRAPIWSFLQLPHGRNIYTGISSDADHKEGTSLPDQSDVKVLGPTVQTEITYAYILAELGLAATYSPSHHQIWSTAPRTFILKESLLNI